MTNEWGTVRIAMEANLFLLYAWNSAPVSGTNLSHCFIALGREFQFPIDFSTNKHWELTSMPALIQSYACNLAIQLTASHKIAKILVEEQCAMHQEFINSWRPNPCIYSVGDIVFARKAVQSIAARGWVDKLSYPFTGPWKITRKLDGASYEIEHCSTKHLDNKHLSALSPCPSEIIPLKPVIGTDNQCRKLNKTIFHSPYIQDGINGFKPPQPFHVSEQYITTTNNDTPFCWPALEEMNPELLPPKDICDTSTDNMKEDIPILYTGPPLLRPTPYAPTIPPANVRAQSIISSANKLFFLSVPVGSGKVCKWRLIQVALETLMSCYSSCLVDGQYLVDYYICHPADCWNSPT